MHFVLVTLDHHLTGAFRRTAERLSAEVPGLRLDLHVAADWDGNEEAVQACRQDLEVADLVVVTQMFMPAHADVIRPILEARREEYRALVCILSEPGITRLTSMGGFVMGSGSEGGWFRKILARLRGASGGAGASGRDSGRRQLSTLRRLPQLLRFIPGRAQDMRQWFLTMQYWLSGSPENLEAMVRSLLARYGGDAVKGLDGEGTEPRSYPDDGLYHPELKGEGTGSGITDDPRALPGVGRPQVGLLLMRSYVLAGNTAHYDAVIRALEARGLGVRAAFAAGLDNSSIVERWFGGGQVEALVSLTGFSLVGGPAWNDSASATALLEEVDVPYLVLQPLEFQTTEAWAADPRGLLPLQAALNVALPELDGAIQPTVFSGRSAGDGASKPLPDRVELVADRVERWVRLRTRTRGDRKVAIVLFNFPPNGGAVGTAAFLDVWASLLETLRELRDTGHHTGPLPETVDALRAGVLEGNRERYGTPANVHARIATDDHVAREPHLEEIEAAWGPAPGRSLTDGSHLLVQGAEFGNVFVGIQPPFGWEGDPMRLLFEGGFAPTHAFSAFYRWVREDFDADALLHFGTHGAVEFMPGKHTGLSAECWPERILASTPLLYLYAANNPSEGTMAKRRGGAVTVSHLTPPVLQAGLYRGLLDLRSALDRLRALPPEARGTEGHLAEVEAVRAQALELDLLPGGAEGAGTGKGTDAGTEGLVEYLHGRLLELEQSLIPHGLHVMGRAPDADARAGMVSAAVLHAPPPVTDPDAGEPEGVPPELETDPDFREALGRAVARVTEAPAEEGHVPDAALVDLTDAGVPETAARTVLERAAALDRGLRTNGERAGLLRALDGRYVPPAPAGDLLRTPELLPTGRNLVAFDPWRVPGAWALREGARQAERILQRYREDEGRLPQTIAMVLWGTDNMKRDGAPVAQALALMGARPVFDAYGRLSGAELIPLDELGRARVDVVITASGIFRDLLPLQVRLLAEAALLCARAEDEPEALNPIRRHALAHSRDMECSLEEAALRVFSNADGAYGAQVNNLVDAGSWGEEEELGESFVNRKGFSYGTDGRARDARGLFRRVLADVEVTYQNLESVELGVSDLDQYFDSLGGLTRAARNSREDDAAAPSAWIGDETRGEGRVRSLEEQVDLEARTRILNPRWIEGMLAHGYQGVREIEARVTNQVGWSATTGTVPGWVYREVGATYVLDPEMRRRLAELNPEAASRLAQRLLEATDRGYWSPDDETMDALQDAADELEDRLEGIEMESTNTEVAA